MSLFDVCVWFRVIPVLLLLAPPPEGWLVFVVLVLPTLILIWGHEMGCRRETGTATHRLSIENQLRTPGLGEPSRG